MIEKDKIKADWASIRITPEQGIVVYTSIRNTIRPLCFENKEALSESLNKKHLIIRKWAISVPDSHCIIKRLELPAQSPAEAFQMIEFELPSLAPISTDTLIYGCTFLNQTDTMIEVLVYILRNDTLEKLLSPYHDIGIHPEKVLPDSISLFSCFESNTSVNAINLYMDEQHFHIWTSLKSYIRSHRIIKSPNLRYDEAKVLLMDNLIQARYELIAYPENINIVIIGSDVLQENIADLITTEALGTDFVFTPISKLLPPECHASFDLLIAKGCFSSIQNKRYEYLNLMSSDYLYSLKHKRMLRSILLNTGLFCLALILIWSLFFVSNWRITHACLKIQRLIAPIEHIATDVDQKKHLVRALQSQFSKRHEISQLFQDLYQFSPKSISISDIQYKQKSGNSFISIKGQSDTLSNAFEYSEALKKSKLIKDLQITNVQQVPTASGSIVEFKAECMIQD